MIKICIWMNIPSHYQSAFFEALNAWDNVDLQVRYFHETSKSRTAEGWKDVHHYYPFEQSVAGLTTPEKVLETVSDAAARIHIISSSFNTELVDYFCAHHIRWCHWSEMPGIRLAELLGYRMSIYRLLNPAMLFMKRKEGLRIRNNALGAFGQGILARRAFRMMGVPERQIADLYYAPAPLPEMEPNQQILNFAKGRKVFLSVAALCRRKGIDVLLNAFAHLKTKEWCLVLCGLDKADGLYQALAEKLGIQDQVLFFGACPIDQIAAVYAAADVFVLASRFDGWGAVLNEAASAGLPLIGTDLCGASWHVIATGGNGFRVKTGSIRSLRNAMQCYVNDPGLIRQQGHCSQELLLKEFSPDKNTGRLISAIAEWQGQVN